MSGNRVFVGGMLILTGVMALLWALGFINAAHVDVFYTLWPVLLIIVGINQLAKKLPLVKLLMWTLVLTGFVYIGNNLNQFPFIKSADLDIFVRFPQVIDLSEQVNEKYSTHDFTEGELVIEGTTLNLMSEANEKGYAEFSYPSGYMDVIEAVEDSKVTYRISEIDKSSNEFANDNSEVEYIDEETGSSKDEKSNKPFSEGIYAVDLLLDQTIPWDVRVFAAVLSGKLDLSGNVLSNLDLEIATGNLEIHIGDIVDDCELHIKSAASTIDLSIPQGVGVKIVKNGFLTNLDLIGEFEEVDQVNYSSNYKSADKKLTIYLDNALGKFQIKH